mgnify:CR=1 FL=1
MYLARWHGVIIGEPDSPLHTPVSLNAVRIQTGQFYLIYCASLPISGVVRLGIKENLILLTYGGIIACIQHYENYYQTSEMWEEN